MADLAIRTTSSFQSGSHPFPSDDIDPKKKDANWGRKFCESMYAAWVNDRTAIPYSHITEIDSLRNYGAGQQDVRKYQKILLDENESGSFEGWMNISWDIFSVMPKFKHIVRGIFEQQDHSIVATAVDPKSNSEKELQKLRMWFQSKYRDEINMIRSINGIEELNEWLPESVDELELYQVMGGLKLAKESEIEEVLDYTFYISDWPEIKRKLIDDFADINCAAVKDYTDIYTGKIKVRYVDPRNLIVQYSRHWDHRNSEYAGEIIRESITNIRKNTGLLEERLRKLAQFYNGKNGNATLASWGEDESKLKDGTMAYDNFQIDVLDGEWFSVNSKHRTQRTNERGETISYDEEWGKVIDKPNRKTTISTHKTVYRCKWIIGTDFVYDFGKQYNISRPGKKEVELSYKFYKLPGRSIVSLSVPNLDQIQLTWLKLQNAIAMSANAGIAVEYTSLQNMKLGGDKMDPIDILSLRRETGDLFYKLTTHTGKMNVPGGFRPIQELEGGIGRQLTEYTQILTLNMEFIRDLTGINRVADASSPDPNQTVGGSQLAVAATTNALRPIYSAYIRLKEQVARSSALRIQIQVKHDPDTYKGYVPITGTGGVKILQFDVENMDADYHIKLQAKPTEQRKQAILQAAVEAMKPDREGYTGIEYGDFLMIERLLEAGNLKFAEYYLAYRSKKKQEQKIKIQRENMEIDSKNQQQVIQVKQEEERQTKQFETDEKIRYKQAEVELEDQTNQREHERQKELLLIQKSAELETKLQTQKAAV